jgi:cell volume regulation protein A
LAAKLNIGNDIFNIVFFCTLTSALLQGWSIPIAARLLRVTEKKKPEIKMPLELTDVKSNNQLIDIIIPYDSFAVGKTLAELRLPSDSLITVICRNEEYIVPNGSSTLEAGDAILVLVNDENLQDVKSVFGKKKKKKNKSEKE